MTKGLVEFDDGIIGYSSNYSTISGFGLAADNDIVKSLSGNTFFDIAYSRGFNVFTSLIYLNLNIDNLSNEDILNIELKKIFFMKGKNLDKWKFSLLHYDKRTNIAFIKFEPKL